MGKLILIVIGSLVVIIIGVVLFTSMNKSSENVAESTAVVPTASAVSDKTADQSRYKPYSSSVFEQSGNKRRVLFFYADWCPTCRPADTAFIQKANQIPQDVAVIRVNYNDTNTDAEEKALATQYQITYQHTFVQIDENSEVVTKWNGGELPELLANIK